jgi:hypothetical protein
MRFGIVLFVTTVGVSATLVGCSRRTQELHGAATDASHAATSTSPTAIPSSEDPLAMPVASIEAVVNPEGAPVYSGPTGSIEGTILVKGPDAPDLPNVRATVCPAAMDTYGKLFRAGPARPDGLRPLADAVVAVTGYQGFYIPERERAARVTITPNCAYPTRTIAMTFGQWLEVSNDSKQPFGPYLEYVVEGAVRVAPPQQAGEPVKVYPPRAGYFSMRDRLQPYVHEDIYVLRQPLHAVTDLVGHFRIDGVPIGQMKVNTKLYVIESEASAEVEVRENVVQNVELVLTYAPKPPAKPPADAGNPGRRLSPND